MCFANESRIFFHSIFFNLVVSTTFEMQPYKHQINNCLTKRRLRHPGASTIGSQLLDGDCSHGWQIQVTQPWAPTRKEIKTGNRHTDKTVERTGKGRQPPRNTCAQENANAHKTLTKMPPKPLQRPMDQEHEVSQRIRIYKKTADHAGKTCAPSS